MRDSIRRSRFPAAFAPRRGHGITLLAFPRCSIASCLCKRDTRNLYLLVITEPVQAHPAQHAVEWVQLGFIARAEPQRALQRLLRRLRCRTRLRH